ncbi:MAG: SUMF1/EgtB/PvdO family nonheme iron enzyme [Blastocatellia bacterium]|nr:SUMF1/EgtB/PvdO family nonheme iron enzyme [Blastocatellia bacterium]
MKHLTLEQWDSLSAIEAEAFARQLAQELPTGFEFEQVRRYQLGDQNRLIAGFRFQQTPFVLIPGGTVTLGFDLAQNWKPNPDELESWQQSAEEYEIEDSLEDFLSFVTLRPREVTFSPFLIETRASEVGWQEIPESDPVVQEAIKNSLQGGTNSILYSQGNATTRVTRAPDGTITARRAKPVKHSGLTKELAKAGFRFPTSDEWEYVCGGGAGTLFRWGDHAPCDRYPTDISPAEAAWRTKWVESFGKLEYPAEGFEADFDLHRKPNGFGVQIAEDPYKMELTAEPDLIRGGDGGSVICGGAGFFLGWMTLATSYFEEHVCRRNPKENIQAGYTIGRRVLPLT